MEAHWWHLKQMNVTSLFVLDAKLIQRDVNVESTSHLVQDPSWTGCFFSPAKKLYMQVF